MTIGGVTYHGPETANVTDTIRKPVVTDPSADDVKTDSAMLVFDITPDESVTTWWVEYGTDPTMPAPLGTAPQTLAANSLPDTQWKALDGLAPGTTYYFGVVAVNDDGSTSSVLKSFTTAARTTTVADKPGPDTKDTTGNAGSANSSGGSASGPTAVITSVPAIGATPGCRTVSVTATGAGLRVPGGSLLDATYLTVRGHALTSTTKVLLDGKTVPVIKSRGAVKISAAALRAGQHTLTLGTGKAARKVTLKVTACATTLRAYPTKTGAAVELTTAPGVGKATIGLPAGTEASAVVVCVGTT